MPSTIVISSVSPFDSIKQVRPDGTEYWSARDLQELMGYSEWRKFEGSIERAKESAKNQGLPVEHHFVGADKMVEIGSGAQRGAKDYELTRIAGYLVSLNGDPRKKEVAAAQAYFVVNTLENESRKAEEPKALTKYGEATQEIELLGALAKAFPLTTEWAQRQAVATTKKAIGMTSELPEEERLITAQSFLLESGYKKRKVEGKKTPVFMNDATGHVVSDSVFGRKVAETFRQEYQEEPLERVDEATGRRMKFYQHSTHHYIFEQALAEMISQSFAVEV